MLLIKNAEIFAPEYKGKKDILICGSTIEHIADEIKLPEIPCQVIDGSGKYLVPGLIDQHVHITGGGGEGGFRTRTPEIQLSELIRGGITTVVGLLGTDGATRSIEDLYAKTMALNEEGVTAYMMTGAYNYDGPTITGDPGRDIMFCENVLGVKLAISDHRSSNITYKELISLASKSRVAGMLSGKPGIVVLHMGNGKSRFQPIFKALEKSEIPIIVFRPTHVGRGKKVREEAFEFLEKGGYIDFTCGARKEGKPTDHIKEAMARDLPLDRITVSTDGHGSWSTYNEDGSLKEMGVASVENLMRDLRHMVVEGGFTLNNALPFFTSNVAAGLGLKNKGVIREQADADILLLNRQLMPDTVIAKGKVMMENGELQHMGTYE